ncbi:hypothetical protein [Paractinoplanes durhamensis]|uniref:Lipoprotein n=1 Tax=Paractinoplanes durhamensis TaxID=113563 RepID=A0ABQ3YZ61_9ACTN|nr:hypothetical protein [Actinoplanes durhamensis]GIE02883.1 hypothetical protein Adu01nite_42330 [Actinoplanes durhamensis]
MRTRTVAALALMSALAAGGCVGAAANDPQVASAQSSTAKPSSSASSSADDDQDAQLKFSQCMRDQGITWFPDPVDGKMEVFAPKGTDMKKMEAAQQACRKFLPNGGQPPKMSAEELEQARNMAKCMRENGIPNFPDPDPNGGMMLDASKLGTKPGDPTWDKAEAACAQYRPKGGKHVEGHSDGNGAAIPGTVTG